MESNQHYAWVERDAKNPRVWRWYVYRYDHKRYAECDAPEDGALHSGTCGTLKAAKATSHVWLDRYRDDMLIDRRLKLICRRLEAFDGGQLTRSGQPSVGDGSVDRFLAGSMMTIEHGVDDEGVEGRVIALVGARKGDLFDTNSMSMFFCAVHPAGVADAENKIVDPKPVPAEPPFHQRDPRREKYPAARFMR